MKKILIVGGSGFIGSHIVLEALNRGYDVTILSLTKRELSIPIPSNRSVTIINADVTKKDELEFSLHNCRFNYVINCSGYIDHTPFSKGGRKLIDQHLIAVINLTECLNRSELESFIQIGSSDEYGNAPAPQKEDLRECPISPYSFGKVAATHFLQMLYRTESFPSTIVRIFLSYGPGQDEKRFLPQIIRGCLDNRAFPVSGGEQIRDFCFIRDIVNGVFLALENRNAQGEIVNIASGFGITIKKMVELVRDIIGGGNPEFGAIPYRINENMKLYADTEKAKSILNWQVKTSLEDGLRETIGYYESMQIGKSR